MKTILINASPRKNWNTAQLVKEAMKGAEAAGAEVEYIDLYDLQFNGCMSCMACKAKGAEKAKCFWKDDLSPVISSILASDNLIIGSPIYFGEPTAHYRALMERLLFVTLSYGGDYFAFNGKVDVGIIYTMNGTQADYENSMKPALSVHENAMKMFLHGNVEVFPSYDTLQVSDYSKYHMEGFNEAAKKERHQNQFPIDLKAAFDIGFEMNKM